MLVLASAPIALGSSPTPQESSRYAPDRLLVRFREAPSETDLEIFTGRQFLTFVQYIGLDYPAGQGWYVFRIDDLMDAAHVRDLLRKDPMVCNAELVAIGEYFAIGLPGAENSPPCVELPSAGPEETAEAASETPGGPMFTNQPGPSGPPHSQSVPWTGAALLVLVVAVVAALASWYRRRERTRR